MFIKYYDKIMLDQIALNWMNMIKRHDKKLQEGAVGPWKFTQGCQKVFK